MGKESIKFTCKNIFFQTLKEMFAFSNVSLSIQQHLLKTFFVIFHNYYTDLASLTSLVYVTMDNR